MARQNGKSKWADSPDQLAERSTMDVTLPSGNKVTLRTVTLDELIIDEALPADLVGAAYLDSSGMLPIEMHRAWERQAPEEIQKFSRDALAVRERLVIRALVAPAPTAAVVASLDQFDRRMIEDLAQRRRNRDWLGKEVGPEEILADYVPFPDGPDSPAGGDESGVAGVAVPDVQPG